MCCVWLGGMGGLGRGDGVRVCLRSAVMAHRMFGCCMIDGGVCGISDLSLVPWLGMATIPALCD